MKIKIKEKEFAEKQKEIERQIIEKEKKIKSNKGKRISKSKSKESLSLLGGPKQILSKLGFTKGKISTDLIKKFFPDDEELISKVNGRFLTKQLTRNKKILDMNLTYQTQIH